MSRWRLQKEFIDEVNSKTVSKCSYLEKRFLKLYHLNLTYNYLDILEMGGECLMTFYLTFNYNPLINNLFLLIINFLIPMLVLRYLREHQL